MMFAGILFVLYGASWASYEIRDTNLQNNGQGYMVVFQFSKY